MKRMILFLLGLVLLDPRGLWGQTTILFPVGSGPFASDIDLQANTVVVVNRNNNSVSILDLATNTIKKTITVGTGPTSVAINPSTNRAVVTNFGSNNISIIDLGNQSVLASVTVGNGPRAVALDTQHNVAIIANLNANSVSLIDLNSNTNVLTQPLLVGRNPIAVAYDPGNNRALVANFQDSNLSVVDLTLKTVTKTISVGLKPIGIAINSDTKRAVIANQDTNDATILNLTDDSIVNTVSVGVRPFAVAIDPKTNIAAVLSNGDRSISLINLGGDMPSKFTTEIFNVGENPSGLTINSNNNTALVANPTTDSLVIVPLGFLTYLPFSFDTGVFRSNLGINNLSSTEANVELELYDQSGKLLAKGSAKVPGRGTYYQRKINQFLLNAITGTNTKGSLKLMSDQPVSAFLTIVDNLSNDSSVERGHSTGYSNLVANAVTNVGAYRSQFLLLNLGNTSAAVTVTAYDSETGKVLGTKTGISIPVGGFFLSEDIMTYLGLKESFGSLQIESPNLQPLIGIAILSQSNQTNGLYEAVPIR